VSHPYGSLLIADPHIDEILEFQRLGGSVFNRLFQFGRFARALWQQRYDLAIDLRTGDRGAIFSFLSRATVRVGRHSAKNQFWRNLCFTKIIDNIKVSPLPTHPGADQSLRVVREIGIDTMDSTPKLYISTGDRLKAKTALASQGILSESKYVTLNPFSRWRYKEWSSPKWGEVIDEIWEAHHIPAVIIGAKGEIGGCQQIVAGREGRTINLAGKTTLGELAAVISMSSLHLGVDSAAPHIAAAAGTPTVTIHGPSDWRAWRIVNEHHRVVNAVMDCLPCNMTGCDGSGKSRCLDDLPAEPVISMALDVLSLRH
jgi:heptosyltransferase-3